MKKHSRMLFVTVATASYVTQAKQLFASAHEAGFWQGDYMLLTCDIGDEDRQWFESRGIYVKKSDYLISQEAWHRPADQDVKAYHKIVCEKYRLFTEEFKRWDIVVYMDCDIIVTAPLIRLSRIQGFCATIDAQLFLRGQFVRGEDELLIRNGYDIGNYSFCSGMFAFSTDVIEAGTLKNILALHQTFFPISRFPDQLILNLFFYKKWKKISMAYAFMLTNIEAVPLTRPTGAIALHFATANERPWQPQSAYYELWKRNLEKAEMIDFLIPKAIDWHIETKAFLKEKLFVPWLLYLEEKFSKRYHGKNWYPLLRNIYRSIKTRYKIVALRILKQDHRT